MLLGYEARGQHQEASLGSLGGIAFLSKVFDVYQIYRVSMSDSTFLNMIPWQKRL